MSFGARITKNLSMTGHPNPLVLCQKGSWGKLSPISHMSFIAFGIFLIVWIWKDFPLLQIKGNIDFVWFVDVSQLVIYLCDHVSYEFCHLHFKKLDRQMLVHKTVTTTGHHFVQLTHQWSPIQALTLPNSA